MQTPKINKYLNQKHFLNIAPLISIVFISRNKQKRHLKASKQYSFFSFYLITSPNKSRYYPFKSYTRGKKTNNRTLLECRNTYTIILYLTNYIYMYFKCLIKAPKYKKNNLHHYYVLKM